MVSKASDSKRLAKNTLLLYFRTVIVLFIGLYTSRIILNNLGIDDYGIYSVVGGFVSMFGIISHTLTSTTQRFLNFELGKEDGARSREIFGASMTIHILLSIILLLLFETIGVWFLNNKMNISSDRIIAANWAFQCSIITFILNVVSQPYNAAIIAHEKMNAFAYISLLDAILKLAIVFLIKISTFDRLIFYCVLLLCEAFLIRSIYSSYSRKHFNETHYSFTKDISIYKEITGFASLNFLGVLASTLSGQGVNMLINIFYGVTLNAARGISVQVSHAILKFVDDFMTALKPQITKTCAAGEYKEMELLCHRGSKYSYYLILLFAIPIFIKTPYVLNVWLKNFPENTIIFVRLTLLLTLFTVLSKTTITAILASGKIKRFTYMIGTINLCTLPICYIILKMGYPVYSVYIVNIVIEIILLITRLFVLRKLLQFQIINFIKEVIVPIIFVTIPSFYFSYLISKYIEDSILSLLLYVLCSIVIVISIIIIIGLKKQERLSVIKIINKKIRKH